MKELFVVCIKVWMEVKDYMENIDLRLIGIVILLIVLIPVCFKIITMAIRGTMRMIFMSLLSIGLVFAFIYFTVIAK